MSLSSRKEYMTAMRHRYAQATSRADKAALIDELVSVTGFHRKYAIQALHRAPAPGPVRRHRTLAYVDALPAIALAWEALDYPCAERLHPVLLETVERLAAFREIHVDDAVRDQLTSISRATLARRLAKMPRVKVTRTLPRPSPGSIKSQVPIDRYDWDENRPGAVETDLVEHNGGTSLGHFAYTVHLTDVVLGWSARRAVLGRGSRAVSQAISQMVAQWPVPIWGLHVDNGSEFINVNLVAYAREHHLHLTRSRPYRKNDNAHIEQKNRQFVREIVGYDRYDSPAQVEWLNAVYDALDPYVNLFVPMRKVVGKDRHGAHVRKTYDTARSPAARLLAIGTLDPDRADRLRDRIETLNPLALHRDLERLITAGPAATSQPLVQAR
jgi:hypothetical protein